MNRHFLPAISLALAIMTVSSTNIFAQRPGSGGNHRGSGTVSSVSRPGSSNGNNTNRPGGNNNPPRPGGNNNSPRPGGNNNSPRPGGNNNSPRPGGNNNSPRPGGNNNSPRPGGNNNNPPRPGGNHNNPPRPGGNHNNPPRPGGNHWGNSAPRPGVGATPSPRPGYNYRPPRVGRWERPLPPPPTRVTYRPVVYGVPSISSVLGLTFGSLFDYGVRSLISAGYNISGAVNNAIYLNNVAQFGIVWPQATIYYGNNGMQTARFQYSSYSPNTYNFSTAYNALCAAYGNPVQSETVNGVNICTWWGGNNTGYVTLQYGPGLAENGSYQYYTDLIYGN